MIRLALSGGRLPSAISEADLQKTGRVVSKILRLKRTLEVGIRFVSTAEIQRLNKAFMGKNRPTDVLSFSASDAGVREPKSVPYLGDIAICTPYASREARRRSIPVREELIRLLVHGILHLRGYDHCTEQEEMKMFQLQERAVEMVTS